MPLIEEFRENFDKEIIATSILTSFNNAFSSSNAEEALGLVNILFYEYRAHSQEAIYIYLVTQYNIYYLFKSNILSI